VRRTPRVKKTRGVAYRRGAERIAQILRGAREPGAEHAYVGRALNAILTNPSAARTVLARALSDTSVWGNEAQWYLRETLKGTPTYKHLMHLFLGMPVNVQQLLQKAEAFAAADGGARVYEQHIARALQDMNGSAPDSMLSRLRIDGERLVLRVIELEGETDAGRRKGRDPHPEGERDSLTGLGSRGAYDSDLVRMLEESRGADLPLAMIVVDLDNFKSLNDDLGHPVGDGALQRVAREMVKIAHGRGCAYRYGGEEFVVVLPNATGPEACAVAERLRANVQRLRIKELGRQVTVSVGVAVYPTNATNAETLFKEADDAMYVAKRGGKNQIQASGRRGAARPAKRRRVLRRGAA
jgi:diguanylate cyclase (GGDEF)-like protein